MKKKFQYTCRNCGNQQIVELNINSRVVYKIVCKRCGFSRYINNESGILKNLKTENRTYSNQKVKESVLKSFLLKIIDFLEDFLDSFRDYGSLLRKAVLILFLLFGITFIGMGIFTISTVFFFHEEEYLVGLNQNTPNVIYDSNGKVLAELFDVKISDSKYNEIPPEMVKLLLFVEDKNFFSHGGIDYFALIRAVLHNITSLRYEQGASTITQQLARILLNRREKTLARKFKEALLAFALERKYTKEEILTLYMNHVYLGHGAYGFKNAALFYYNKSLESLNFTERLSLVCLPSNRILFSYKKF
jgi:membrane peptidoglycan carboxypeptidase/DNA-directed RNA polymerase subunit RPC12/RpoP